MLVGGKEQGAGASGPDVESRGGEGRSSPGAESEAGIQVGIQPAPGETELPPAPWSNPRRGTAILQRYEEQALNTSDAQGGARQEWERAAAMRHAAALRNAKERGLATPGMIEHATARPGLNPYAVSELSLAIQQGFRKKMLTLLALQMAFTVAVAFFVRYTPHVNGGLERAFPPQKVQSLVLLLAVMTGLPVMSCIKDSHPWNLLFTAAWSVLLGLFLGASDLPGAYSRAHAFLMIYLELTLGVLLLTPLSLCKTRGEHGQRKLWGFGAAGMCSWVLTVVIAAVVFTQSKASVNWDGIAPEPIFATSTVVSTIIFSWFCYEAFKLTCRMKPDEYMKGVIYFYTDMFYMCACCAVMACLGGGGGGGGAPPRDEEER